jgi:hypothetical protein
LYHTKETAAKFLIRVQPPRLMKGGKWGLFPLPPGFRQSRRPYCLSIWI